MVRGPTIKYKTNIIRCKAKSEGHKKHDEQKCEQFSSELSLGTSNKVLRDVIRGRVENC